MSQDSTFNFEAVWPYVDETMAKRTPPPSEPVAVPYAVPKGWEWAVRTFGMPLWGQLFFSAFLFALGVGGTIVWISYGHLGNIDVHLGKIDGALQVLVPRDARDAMFEAKEFAQNGDLSAAKDSLRLATELIEAAASHGYIVRPAFFQTALRTTNQIAAIAGAMGEIDKDVYQLRIALATYRSASQTIPASWTSKPVQTSYQIIEAPQAEHLEGSVMRWYGPPNVDFFRFPPVNPPRLYNGSFTDMAFEDGQFTLDNKEFKNVKFLRTHIVYHGGPLHLAHVQFINCTFDISNTPGGSQFTEYAVLDLAELKVAPPA